MWQRMRGYCPSTAGTLGTAAVELDSGHEGGGNDSRLETQGYLGGGNVKW